MRLPAHFNGCVGLKPTYGRVSRYGLLAYASSLDCIGTMGRSVGDAATALEVVSGHDAMDATSLHAPVRPPAASGVHRLGKYRSNTNIGPLEHVCWLRKGICWDRSRSWSNVCSGPIFGVDTVDVSTMYRTGAIF